MHGCVARYAAVCRGAALAGQVSNQDKIEKKYLSLANQITTCWRPIGGFKKTPSLPQLDGSANSENPGHRAEALWPNLYTTPFLGFYPGDRCREMKLPSFSHRTNGLTGPRFCSLKNFPRQPRKPSSTPPKCAQDVSKLPSDAGKLPKQLRKLRTTASQSCRSDKQSPKKASQAPQQASQAPVRLSQAPRRA